ncbi:MAG: DUF805 domain-containing protein [Asticcacaulis sp.]|nr:DUF805 domain-containing protein [Asticcacaulis sp.]
MNPKTDWAELFLSATGRVRQLPFTVAAVLILFAVALYQSAFKGPVELFTGWVFYPAIFYIGACVLSKRLHDRGRSGWWAAIILSAMVMAWPRPQGFFDFIAVVVLVWATIDLCVMPGERGDNRYGKTLHRLKPREQV